jgi:hypothetical protein
MRFSIKRDNDRHFWFSSPRKSLESLIEKNSWNWLKRRAKTPDRPPLNSQTTIVVEEDSPPQTVQDSSVVEPVAIIKSTKTFASDSKCVFDSKQVFTSNLFTPRKHNHIKRSGKITPEFPARPFRRGATSPTDFSSSWNSLSLRLPPTPSTPPSEPSIQEINSNTCQSTTLVTVEQSVNSIIQKLSLDPVLKSRITCKSRPNNRESKKISIKSFKHLPLIEEPLSSMSNLEVFEQDSHVRISKRAWTVSSSDPRNTVSWISWMTSSLTLNALSLPSLVIPSNLLSTHLRKSSSIIELSPLCGNERTHTS